MRYVPQLKRNFIFVDALKMFGLVISIRDGVLKMTKGSMVVMKGVCEQSLLLEGQYSYRVGGDLYFFR